MNTMKEQESDAESEHSHEHEGYLGLLNDEVLVGSNAARALLDAGVGSRDALLRANPSWVRIGTFQELLRRARQALDSDASVALELTTFVLAHLDEVPPLADDAAFLMTHLQGTAWKEHANALFMLTRLDDALDAANRAVSIFSHDPFHVVYRASARVVVALVKHGLHRNEEAIPILEEAIGVFAEHSDTRGYIAALQVRAMIALAQHSYTEALDLYLAAYREAERSGDKRERSRILNNLALCEMRLGQLDFASAYMAEAYLGFTRERMDGELQRAIWLTAAIERERGDLDAALRALHGVYARFLERGMVTEAARVLVQVGDVVTDLTGDVAYAKDICAKLAVTLGRYNVPAEVRKAVDHLKDAGARTHSVAGLRAVLGHVGAFLREFLGSPSAVFHATLTD